MNLNSKKGLIDRLRRGRKAREQFVDSHLGKGIAHQLRATRETLGWSQERLAKEAGTNQNAISRLESTSYGKPTITTLKRMAAAMDVGLIVRFVPFSEMINWVSGTPQMIIGLSSAALAVPEFNDEERRGVFEDTRHISEILANLGAAESAQKRKMDYPSPRSALDWNALKPPPPPSKALDSSFIPFLERSGQCGSGASGAAVL